MPTAAHTILGQHCNALMAAFPSRIGFKALSGLKACDFEEYKLPGIAGYGDVKVRHDRQHLCCHRMQLLPVCFCYACTTDIVAATFTFTCRPCCWLVATAYAAAAVAASLMPLSPLPPHTTSPSSHPCSPSLRSPLW